MATIELMKDKRGEFRFRLKAKNGETIATSESYRKKDKALATIKAMKSGVGGAKLIDLTAAKPVEKKAAKQSTKEAAKKTTKKVAKKTSKKASPAVAKKPAMKAAKPSEKPSMAKSKSSAKSSKPAMAVAASSIAADDAPRLFSPASTPRVIDEPDARLDSQPEGADVVMPDDLGEGDQVSSDIEVGDDDSID